MTRQARLSEEPEAGSGTESQRSDSAQTADSSDQTLPPQTLQQKIAQLEAENDRLTEEKRSRELEGRNQPLQPRAETDTEEFEGLSEHAAPSGLRTARTLRPEKLRPYYGNSEGEHIRWFADAEIIFLLSPEYFTTERAKILYCMQSLEGDAATQWRLYFRKDRVDEYSFEDFSRFLLDMVADPVKRRLLAYDRYCNTKQQPGQMVLAFEAYLEELEAHMVPLPEEFRVNMFLSGLRSELKSKILSIGNVPTTRESLLALAMMQEKNLERYQPTPRSSGKGKVLEERVSGAPTGSAGDSALEGCPRGSKRRRTSTSHPAPQADSGHRNGSCYLCGQTRYWKPECPHKDDPSFVPAGFVRSKNDHAPLRPSQRRRKDK
ncbi:hypothetical protein N7G274_009305 [Stereocaulon virgatum]|uniref:Retrotransposon gag domain-containing protein n=1 Tax=Stereocaulon virgatum TaxID=373712 RepID=A0ABR3ZYK8_9LECA